MALPVHKDCPRDSPQEGIVFVRRLRKLVEVAAAILVFAFALVATAEDGRAVKSKVAPIYPELAKRMNVSGTVKIQVVVAPNGVVKSAKVIGGHPLLVDPAMDAAKKWRYEPASEETTNVVEFHFDPNANN
jgi:TonB family protein